MDALTRKPRGIELFLLLLLGEFGLPGTQLFEDKNTSPLKCVVQSSNTLSTFPQYQENQSIKQTAEEVINK